MEKSGHKHPNGSLESSARMKESNVPVIYPFIVLRKEYFGGFIFNPYLPPEARLDRIRFKIASLCHGRNTIEEIKSIIGNDLNHSAEYIDELVKGTVNSFKNSCAISLQEGKTKSPKYSGNIGNNNSNILDGRQLSAPLFVIWEITSACNLRCKHCLSDSGKPLSNELSTEEVKELIDSLAMMKVFYINFSGGEPLVRPDIFEILEYASKKSIGIDLLTNGALITKEVISRFENTNIFHVQISLDGIGKTHDAFRGINGSYERAIKAIKLLRDANYGVSISSAVTKQNLDEIPKIIDLAVDLGANLYKTTLFMPAGRGKKNVDDLVLTPHDAKRLAFMMIEKKKEVGDRITISNEEIYPWLTEPSGNSTAGMSPAPDSSKVGCTAANSSLYITPDGKIAPCPFLREFTAGNIRKEELKGIWNDSSTFGIFRNIKQGDLKGKCGRCDHLGIRCYGGCRAAAYAHNGDLYAEDPLCWREVEKR
jgi:mycofactocin radical SAM maturase